MLRWTVLFLTPATAVAEETTYHLLTVMPALD